MVKIPVDCLDYEGRNYIMKIFLLVNSEDIVGQQLFIKVYFKDVLGIDAADFDNVVVIYAVIGIDVIGGYRLHLFSAAVVNPVKLYLRRRADIIYR